MKKTSPEIIWKSDKKQKKRKYILINFPIKFLQFSFQNLGLWVFTSYSLVGGYLEAG
jgi:hypothetical protein